MTVELDQALAQLAALDTFRRFSEQLPIPPIRIPPDPVRAAGLDPDVWHGLGIVGIWAAVDAFAERRGHHRNDLRQVLAPALLQAWLEIDDMRHLYAHNFAGLADQAYFTHPRNYLAAAIPYTLTSGNKFDGHHLVLRLQDLAFYVDRARLIVRDLDATWP
ncbi:MAG TPA: hypothetical protein VGL99_04580 [Chloroflexota bacterium]